MISFGVSLVCLSSAKVMVYFAVVHQMHDDLISRHASSLDARDCGE